MDESVSERGLTLVCETCESEIDFPDDLATEVGVCRQCGLAFLLDVPHTSGRSTSGHSTSGPSASAGDTRTA